MENFPIKVSVATATKDEIERGLAAACAVFIKSGIDPETAAAGRSKLEAFDMQGFKGKLSSEACDAAFVWMEAEAAAAEAASANWSEDRLPAFSSSSRIRLCDFLGISVPSLQDHFERDNQLVKLGVGNCGIAIALDQHNTRDDDSEDRKSLGDNIGPAERRIRWQKPSPPGLGKIPAAMTGMQRF